VNQQGILSGIRVIEMATYVFGPGAATVMSDFGAEVIKVERPKIGDTYRYLSYLPPMPVAEMNYCWILDGRNKKSIALDLSNAEGRDILLKLIESADVFITNYQPSVLEKLQLRYEDVEAINKGLIYAHATGYGEKGDEVEKPGFDMTAYWARSGLMDAVHDGDAEPALSVAAMGDHPSAMALFGGILLALLNRQKNGRGTKVSSSLMANGAWANGCLIQAALCNAIPYKPRTRATAVNALVNHYVTRDQRRFIFCLIQPDDWMRLFKAIGHNELLSDERFTTLEARIQNAPALIAILDKVIAEKDLDEWAKIFAEYALSWSLVQTIEDVVEDKQMQANEVFVEFEHSKHGHLRTINSPIFLRGEEKIKPQSAPEIGQDTVEILQSLGYDRSIIRELIERGIAATA
jgi:formyl-CoA transferase